MGQEVVEAKCHKDINKKVSPEIKARKKPPMNMHAFCKGKKANQEPRYESLLQRTSLSGWSRHPASTEAMAFYFVLKMKGPGHM